MKKFIYAVVILLVLSSGLKAQITVNGSNGANRSFTSLTSASGAFAAINASDQSGMNIVITVTGNSLAESGSVSLAGGLWTSLTVYPVAPGLTISGNSPNQLIALNGSKNVTIDGSLNASGSSADLTIINTNTGSSGSAIFFLNSASDNVIKHCNIKGSQTGIKAGIINFGLSASGNGNDTNIIENNNISGNGTARPWNALYSFGTTGRVNDANIIRNNNFFDFFNPGAASTAIMISSYSSGWTITGNSFYETTPLIPTASLQFTFIKIFNPSGSNFTVSDNFFGGTAPLCRGSALTKTNAFNNAFIGITLNVGNSTVSNLQNNTISKINWSNSANANWTGIEIIGGNVNIGTSTGNIIGSQSVTGSIVVSSATAASYTYGIKVSGTGIVNCSDNYIGSIITTNTSSNSSNIIGIIYSGASGSIINHTGVKVKGGELLPGFDTWLTVRSPDGIANLTAMGDAANDVAPLALIVVKGEEKSAEVFLKILPGGAAAMTRPPVAEIDWLNIEQPEEGGAPEPPFEVYVQQLGPNPEAAQVLVRMIQAWDAAGKPNTSRLRLRGIPAGKPVHLLEGEFLIERPWTHFIVWYQD